MFGCLFQIILAAAIIILTPTLLVAIGVDPKWSGIIIPMMLIGLRSQGTAQTTAKGDTKHEQPTK